MKEPAQPDAGRWGDALFVLALVALTAAGLSTSYGVLAWPLLGLGVLLGVAGVDHALLLSLRARERQLDPDTAHDRSRWVDLAVGLLPGGLLLTASWAQFRAHLPAERAPGVALLWLGLLLALRLVAERLRCLERDRGFFERLAQAAVGPLRALLLPVHALAAGTQLAPAAEAEAEAGAEEELVDAIEAGSHEGDLSLVQSELLRREMDLSRTVAAQAMVPRVKVAYLDVDQSFADAVEVVVRSRHSRFPVKRGSVDQVVGVVHAKDLLRWRDQPPATLRKLLVLTRARPPVHVAHDLALDDVLALLRREHVSLAIVDDDFGGVAGIITVEDVVEELVGEIVDESDAGAVAESMTCSARRRLSELAEQGLLLPGEPDQTLAEFLAARLPEPAPGAVWSAGPLRLTVLSLDAEDELETIGLEWTVAPGEPR